MSVLTAIHVQEPDTDPYWTILELSTGQELHDAHRFATQQEAEEMVDVLNGKITAEPERNEPHASAGS